MSRLEYVPGEITLKLNSPEDQEKLFKKVQKMRSIKDVVQEFPDQENWLSTLYILKVSFGNELRAARILQKCQFIEYAKRSAARHLVV